MFCERLLLLLVLLSIVHISLGYKANPTPFVCTEANSKSSSNLPSCLPGYVINIENVVYESTTDQSCSGITLCRLENKNPLMFACNRKRTCSISANDLHFHINATCGSAIRLYTTYRCLPVIHDQTDTLCESSTPRRVTSGDINLSCERNYHLFIRTALVGISLRQQAEATGTRFKCNRDTPTTCTTPVQNAYRDVCDTQLMQGNGAECKIRYHERPMLRDCPYGTTSNFSMVEYSCIPGDGVKDDLPRIDICSTETSERLTADRGLLHSPNYPQVAGKYLFCKKQLYLPRQSRLRVFMLEKSLEYSHELNIHLSNGVRTLADNEFFDTNNTERNEELVSFELKTNHLDGGRFLLYFQVDSHLSTYAPFVLEPGRKPDGDRHGRGKSLLRRTWVIALACFIVLLLLILAAVLAFLRVSKRRRERSLRYLKSDDDHREHLNTSKTSPVEQHHQSKNLHLEQPYLASSPPAILPSTSANGHPRPQSASSTTSSIIMHQVNDGLSDRESLIKPTTGQAQQNANTDIDNLYEEIKEQQHQTALALGLNGNKGPRSAQPIGDHHENGAHYQHPKSSVEQIKRPRKPPPPIPTEEEDSRPSAPREDATSKAV